MKNDSVYVIERRSDFFDNGNSWMFEEILLQIGFFVDEIKANKESSAMAKHAFQSWAEREKTYYFYAREVFLYPELLTDFEYSLHSLATKFPPEEPTKPDLSYKAYRQENSFEQFIVQKINSSTDNKS